MKNRIVPIVALAAGLLAFALTRQYLRSEYARVEKLRNEIYANARKVRVVAAAREIPAGTVIRDGDLGAISIFEASAPDYVIVPEDATQIYGRKTLVSIQPKKPVLWSYIEGGAPSSRSLSARIPHNMRAVTLAIGGAASVGGMAQPGDRVDVLGTFSFAPAAAQAAPETVTLTLLQDVTVLAVGQRLANQGDTRATAGSGNVTLEVTPREAELLVFAQQIQGSLNLTLRHPNDGSFERDLPDVNFKHIEERLPELNLFRQKNIRGKKGI